MDSRPTFKIIKDLGSFKLGYFDYNFMFLNFQNNDVQLLDDQWFGREDSLNFYDVESLQNEIQTREMSEDGELIASKPGVLDNRTEWAKIKLFEINMMMGQAEKIHTRQITTVIDLLGNLGGMSNLLFVIAAVFMTPIA